ncbi:MAG: gamma carbonic anhydrase family protein [Acidobacteriota bacterium]
MPIVPHHDATPLVGDRVFLAPSAWVTGEVTIGDDVSFWFHTVARGDVHWIRIGDGTNVQDGSVLHVTHERFPLSIGRGVVIGHGAVVHGCTLEDGCLIGIGARVLDGAVVEAGAQVAAGAVVAPGARVPAGQLAMGVPARVRRALTDAERREIGAIRDRYVRLKDDYRRMLGDGIEPVSARRP